MPQVLVFLKRVCLGKWLARMSTVDPNYPYFREAGGAEQGPAGPADTRYPPRPPALLRLGADPAGRGREAGAGSPRAQVSPDDHPHLWAPVAGKRQTHP